MTYFPNFGLLNNMTQHFANNGTPKVLNYEVNGNTGYTYAPVSTDLVSQTLPANDPITRQQRFNAAINDLLFSQKQAGITTEPTRDATVINSLMTQQPTQAPTLLPINTSAAMNQIEDSQAQQREQYTPPVLETVEKQGGLNIAGVIIVIFILFMLVQLYLNQKKMEFLMSIAARQPYPAQRGAGLDENRLIF